MQCSSMQYTSSAGWEQNTQAQCAPVFQLMRGHAVWCLVEWCQMTPGHRGEEGCERRATLCQDQPVLWATKGGTHSASGVPTTGQRQCHRGGTRGEVVFLNNVPGWETAANQRSAPDRNMDTPQPREMEPHVCRVFLQYFPDTTRWRVERWGQRPGNESN